MSFISEAYYNCLRGGVVHLRPSGDLVKFRSDSARSELEGLTLCTASGLLTVLVERRALKHAESACLYLHSAAPGTSQKLVQEAGSS